MGKTVQKSQQNTYIVSAISAALLNEQNLGYRWDLFLFQAVRGLVASVRSGIESGDFLLSY